jgi:hypothetical protein
VDAHLQDLRRRAGATGTLEDQAAALRAELRRAPGCARCDVTGLERDEALCLWRGPDRIVNDHDIVTCPGCAGTGTPLRGRLELAAYVGDEVAHRALTPDCACGPANDHGGYAVCAKWWSERHPHDLEAFLRGLERWADAGPTRGWVLARAAVAAARVALDVDPTQWSEISRWKLTRRAIEAAEAWLACPSEERWTAWHVAFVDAAHLAWLPAPAAERSLDRTRRTIDSIRAAAALASEAAVRAAIRDALVAFALGAPRA